jgi:hypothetical protein
MSLQAVKSIESYGVHAVIANILETRKEQVKIVTRAARPGGETVAGINRAATEPFIEKQIVDQIIAAHRKYIDEGSWLKSHMYVHEGF